MRTFPWLDLWSGMLGEYQRVYGEHQQAYQDLLDGVKSSPNDYGVGHVVRDSINCWELTAQSAMELWMFPFTWPLRGQSAVPTAVIVAPPNTAGEVAKVPVWKLVGADKKPMVTDLVGVSRDGATTGRFPADHIQLAFEEDLRFLTVQLVNVGQMKGKPPAGQYSGVIYVEKDGVEKVPLAILHVLWEHN